MKKNIVIALLLIVTALSVIFSLYQKSQADVCVERSIGLQKNAEEYVAQSKMKEYEAEQQLAATTSQLAETIHQLQIVQEELNKIKGPK